MKSDVFGEKEKINQVFLLMRAIARIVYNMSGLFAAKLLARHASLKALTQPF